MGSSGGTPIECPYITSGLVFWLDGINKGATDGTWVDLIGGIDFTNTDAVSNDDHFYFNGSTSVMKNLTKNLSSVGSVFTVESCFYAENGGAIMYSGPGNNTSLPMLKLDQGLYKQRGLKYNLGSYTNTNSTLSLTDGLGIRNGVTLSGTGSDFWGNDCFSIGSGVSSKRYRHQFKGKVFSVRVYSRILTQSEMLFNQSVDNIRFNLGLTL